MEQTSVFLDQVGSPGSVNVRGIGDIGADGSVAVAADVGTENGAGQVENKDMTGLREGVDTG